jgi:CHAT domain-containing protein/Tfp pilus assembly protein PilF
MKMADSGWAELGKAREQLAVDNLEAALDALGNAVNQFKRSGDAQGESTALGWLASIHNSLGNFDQSVYFHETGLAAAQKIGHFNNLIIDHLDGIGTGYSNLGRWQEAINYYEQALQECNKPIVGLRQLKANILGHLANVYLRYTKRTQEALQLYDQAISIMEQFDSSAEMGYVLTFKGHALDALGMHEQALRLHETARQIATQRNDRGLLAACYAHMSGSYGFLNNHDLRRSCLEKALELDKETGNKQGLNRDYLLLGELFEQQQEYDAAIHSYEDGLLLARSIKDVKNTLHFLKGIADFYIRKQQGSTAEKYLQQALELCRELGLKREEIGIHLSLASIDARLPTITRNVEDALKVAREEGYRDLELQALIIVARVYESGQDFVQARKGYQEIVKFLEDRRSSYHIQEYARAFSEQYSTYYERLVDLHITLGADEDAFYVAEQSRARILNNIIQASQAYSRPISEQNQQQDYRQICNRIIELSQQINYYRQLGDSYTYHVELLVKNLNKALNEETESILKIRQPIDPDQAILQGKIIEVKTVQEQLRNLAHPILVLSYYSTAHNTYVFLISSDDFVVQPLGISQNVLRDLVISFRHSIHGAEAQILTPSEPEQRQLSRQLYEFLLRPVESKLKSFTHLCIIPHGPLYTLPFHALHDGDQYLIEWESISFSYSASVSTLSWFLNHNITPPQNCLAFADPKSELPPLPFARQEIASIQETLGQDRCSIVTGDQATRNKLYTAAENNEFDTWHLATHAVFIEQAPHLSYIQMASTQDDGHMFAFEIADLPSAPKMVVASACETALTGEAAGDELNGLLFSFIAAGSQTVIASLWPVADLSTTSLMIRFYEQIQNSSPYNAALGLRNAQLALLRDSRTSSPYFWAPFTLYGCWSSLPQKDRGGVDITLPVSSSRQPTNAIAVERQAQIHFERGNSLLNKAVLATSHGTSAEELRDAVAEFDKAISFLPEYQLAYRQRGIAYYQQDNTNLAIADLHRAVQLDPNDALASACLGWLLGHGPETNTDALQYLNLAFEREPRIQIRLWKITTYAIQRLQNRIALEIEIATLSELIDKSAATPINYVQRATAYRKLSYIDRHQEMERNALADFQRALELHPNYPPAKLGIAFVEYSNFKPGAVTVYEEILGLDDKSAEAHYRLASAYQYNQQIDESIRSYLTSIQLEPRIAEVYQGLGEAYIRNGDLPKAIDAFEQTIRIDPNNFTAYLYLNSIYRAINRPEESRQAYEDCQRTCYFQTYDDKLGITLDYDIVQWISELARRYNSGIYQKPLPFAVTKRYMDKGNGLANGNSVPQAIECYTELLNQDSFHAAAYAFRGGCYGLLQKFDLGIADCQRAIELDPKCANAYFNLYVIYKSRWQNDKAQQMLDRAIMLDPELAKQDIKNSPKPPVPENIKEVLFGTELETAFEDAYNTSGMECEFCKKKLRRPLGRRFEIKPAEMKTYLDGIPYICPNCKIISCFKCSADPEMGQVICRKCGIEMKIWGSGKN